MGSTGSGSFGNYRIGGEGAGNGTGSSGTGSVSKEIECPDIIENIRLEDVATSEYYTKHQKLPGISSKVNLRSKVHQGRLVMETADTHEVIGNLPTQYNFLLTCLSTGKRYSGQIISSGVTPIPYAVVTLRA